MKGIFKRVGAVGPGGMACPCCAPQSGSKSTARFRQRLDRKNKRRFERLIHLIHPKVSR